MARFQAVSCDGCEKVEPLPQSLEPSAPWVTVKQHGAGLGEVVLCSLKCAIKWAREREKIEKDLRQMTTEEFCESYCIVDEDAEITTHSEHCPRMKAFPR